MILEWLGVAGCRNSSLWGGPDSSLGLGSIMPALGRGDEGCGGGLWFFGGTHDAGGTTCAVRSGDLSFGFDGQLVADFGLCRACVC